MKYIARITYTNNEQEHGKPADYDQFQIELEGNDISIKNLVNQYNRFGVWDGLTMIPPHRIWRIDLHKQEA